MTDTLMEMQREIARLQRELNRFTSGTYVSRHWVYPNSAEWVANGGTALTPLTSTSWDGDSFSTTAKTLIDLSAVFGVPAGVKAVYVWVAIRDSGSAAGDAALTLGPLNTAGTGVGADCSGQTNDSWERNSFIVPCDANGDMYYEIAATGASTMDVHMRIWGYYI